MRERLQPVLVLMLMPHCWASSGHFSQAAVSWVWGQEGLEGGLQGLPLGTRL